MKRKRMIWFFTVVLCCVAIFFYVLINSKTNLSVKKSIVKPIEFSKQYVIIYKGSQVKVVNNSNDVKKIINYINSINYHKISTYDYDSITHWDYMIRLFKNSYTHKSMVFSKDDILQYIDGECYGFDKEAFNKLEELYNNLEYEEVHISKIIK